MGHKKDRQHEGSREPRENLSRWAWILRMCITGMLLGFFNGFVSAALAEDILSDLQFHRLEHGGAEIVLSHSGKQEQIYVERDELQIRVTFEGIILGEHIGQSLDVRDFSTPVSNIQLMAVSGATKMEINLTKSAYPIVTHLSGGLRLEIQESTKPMADQSGIISEDQGEREYKGELMTLNFQQISVREALQSVADFTGLNVVTSDSVEGDLSLRLKDVPWDQALDVILQSKGLAMRQYGNVIWVAPSDEIVEKEQQALELQKAADELEPLVSELIRVSYARVEDMASMIKSVKAIQTGVDQTIFGAVSVSETQTEENSLLSERGSITVDGRTNSLLIQDTRTKLKEIKALIRQLDIPVRQVLIETRIVTARESFSRNIGVRFGLTRVPQGDTRFESVGSGLSIGGGVQTSNPAADDRSLSINLPANAIGSDAAGAVGFTLATIGSGFLNLLDLEISALQAEGNGRVLANPKILTTDKRKATIEQGQERLTTFGTAFGTSSSKGQKAVLSLTVLPQITPDNKVILDVDITNDAFVSANADTVNTQRINTQTLLGNGETVVIGGIYTQEQLRGLVKVPLLGDIPYLGALFRKKQIQNSRSELLIFLTPHIIDSAFEGKISSSHQ